MERKRPLENIRQKSSFPISPYFELRPRYSKCAFLQVPHEA
jgi:hypothetical protein